MKSLLTISIIMLIFLSGCCSKDKIELPSNQEDQMLGDITIKVSKANSSYESGISLFGSDKGKMAEAKVYYLEALEALKKYEFKDLDNRAKASGYEQTIQERLKRIEASLE